ncbi:hypothetical protein [Desulfolutivibrio sp.]|uniref:hypothetical protein n=1 Tax=Desulfolutivibrio sp. TaxID=2773296 RepID=UPI002F96C113
MSPRHFALLSAIALQAWFALAWALALRRVKSTGGDTPSRTFPGWLARLAGLFGVGSGLAYAVMAGDPVFWVGQAFVPILAGRVMAVLSGRTSVRRIPDGDQTGRNPG